MNNANLATQRDEAARRHTAFQNNLRRLFWQTVLVGLAVSLVVVARLRVLERRSAASECEIRALSHQVVNTQEEERKSLSRELHDHVAQVLTGLRMELGCIERTNAGAVVDDGVGIARERLRRRGLGIRGIEERVRELQGTMTIARLSEGGTRLSVSVPIESSAPEPARARVAG